MAPRYFQRAGQRRSARAGRAVRDRSAAKGVSRGRNEQREAQRGVVCARVFQEREPLAERQREGAPTRCAAECVSERGVRVAIEARPVPAGRSGVPVGLTRGAPT